MSAATDARPIFRRLTRPALRVVHDLPGDPPEGEHVLWQGAPTWWALARSLHIRLVASYFAVLLAWYLVNAVHPGMQRADLLGIARVTGLATAALALFAAYALLAARGTSYTLTNRRLVMQIGIALPISFNIPFRTIVNVALKQRADGSGDVVLTLEPGSKLNYIILWPHARPWRLTRAEPMLRAVPDAARLAQQIGALLQAAAPGEFAVQGAAAAAEPEAARGFGPMTAAA